MSELNTERKVSIDELYDFLHRYKHERNYYQGLTAYFVAGEFVAYSIFQGHFIIKGYV